MQVHFQKAILPITVTAALFGFAIIEYPVGKPRRLLSLIYGVVLCFLEIGTTAVKVVFFKMKDIIFFGWVCHALTFYICFNILMGISCTHWQGKRYCQCLEAINHVDETLEKLGFQIDYTKTRRAMFFCVLSYVSWCIILTAIDGLTLMNSYSHLIAFFLEAIGHLPTIIDIHFWCVLGYTGMRFDYINNALRELAHDDRIYLGWFQSHRTKFVGQKLILDEKQKRTIWTVMQLHFQLCRILREINQAFELKILVGTNYAFVYVLGSVIFTFRVVLLPFEGGAFKYCLVIWIWAVLPVLRIVMVNNICENISNKATNVAESTLKLLRVMDDEEMREDVSLILLQTRQNPLRFSGMGLYYYGHPLLQEISCSMVTMVVIILQMKTGLETT